jgi:hypothetical protein
MQEFIFKEASMNKMKPKIIKIKTRKGAILSRRAIIAGKFAQVGIWAYVKKGEVYERY